MTADSMQPSDVAARDDAHLRSLGIRPELNRTLGFISNFAVAFSYISVATGSFTQQAVAIGVGGPPFIWAWVLVVVGQSFVALNFAELSSHFPVAGSIYQWSKRLSNKTLGWFTGWFYFWAGVLTVTAVAATVPLVMSPLFGIDLAAPSPVPFLNTWSFLSIVALALSTAVNGFGVRLLALLNNLGVAAEIFGMIVLALVLLIFANHQPLSVIFDTSYTSGLAGGNYFAVFLVGMFLALFVVYGFDTAGTFGEETVDASRHAPRGVLTAIWLSGIAGFIFLLAVILSFKDMNKAVADGQAFGFPFANTIKDNLTASLGGVTLGDVYLVVILIAVSVCTLAIQGATTRLMFSMGRDGRLPMGSTWAHVNQTFKTPTNAAVGVGVLAVVPFLVTGASAAFYLAIAATGTIYISYFLCNWGVFAARRKGWPHKDAWFKLGSWGTVINVLALVWGGAMVINIGLWNDTGLFGDFGNELRAVWSNPPINTFIQWNGETLAGLPAWPVFETFVGAVLLIGALYYYLSGQSRREDVAMLAPDAATGEAAIA